MPDARRTSRAARRTVAALALCAALALQAVSGFGTAAAASSSTEVSLTGLINQARGDVGLGPLSPSDRLSATARKHSAKMAQERRLIHHRCLSCTFHGGAWNVMGENVGAGSSIGAVHRKMMRSASHRDNILQRGYDRVGVGVVRARGMVWVTEIFVG